MGGGGGDGGAAGGVISRVLLHVMCRPHWKNRLCRNVEVIQHNCNRWHRRREAKSAKHDSSVSVSAQAACFDTNL